MQLYRAVKSFSRQLNAVKLNPGEGMTIIFHVFEQPILKRLKLFRNELFQIGGYRLLRGFDEESIFASQYGVATVEYRYLIGQNSFLFGFSDVGWARNNSLSRDISNTFIGAGLGMAFETKAGIFNISYASGKRDDAKFNLRQSKIHIGYVNYF